MISSILDMESTNMVSATSYEKDWTATKTEINFTEDIFDSIDDLFDLPDEDIKSLGETNINTTINNILHDSSRIMTESFNISIYESIHTSLHSHLDALSEPQCFPSLTPDPLVGKGPESPCFPEFGFGMEGNKLTEEDISNDFETSSTISISDSNSCSSKIPSSLDMIVPRKSRSKGSRAPVTNCASRIIFCDSYALVSEDCPNSMHVGDVPVYCNLDYSMLEEAKCHPSREIYSVRHAITRKRKSERQCKECTHCGISKTPQWRAGPLGPKTLCNACGVRYSSGRLLPEYRPAASPTFSADKHSNSHRKVLEMRIGKGLSTPNH